MGSGAELGSESESAGSPNLEDTIEALRKKAHAALSDAEVLLRKGSPEATINRGYYTVFQAARAALLTEEEKSQYPLRRYASLQLPLRSSWVSIRRDRRHSYDRTVDARTGRLRGVFGLRPRGGR
jgi:exonuclease VII large subunit